MKINEYILEYRPLEEVLEKSTVYAFELEKQGKQYDFEVQVCAFHDLFNLKITIWE